VGLLKIAPNAPAQAVLVEMTMQGEIEARVAALTALGEWGDASTFDLIAAQLSKSVPAIRRAAIPALAQVGAERARDFLIHALGDDDTSVREAAAAALGGMGGSALERRISLQSRT
jgi:HEAT repeat protein